MNTPSLSRITMETMANYRTAAVQVVAASGAGSRRLVRAVDGALQNQVLPRTSAVAPRAGERLDDLRGNVSRLVEQGIDQAVVRSEQVIDRSSEFAVAQVTRWADFAADVDNKMLASGLQTAARISLPAAQLALKVSGKVAEGATQLADVAGAHPVRKAARQGAAVVRRRVAKTTRQAEVQVKAVRRRAAKAVAKVAEVPQVKRARRVAKKATAAAKG